MTDGDPPLAAAAVPAASPRELGLRRSDMSAVCRAAADLSARGQRLTKRLVQVELTTLVLAAVAGLTTVRVGPAGVDVLAAVAGLLFMVSLGCLVYRSLSRPENAWYMGRAAAESVRTMAWRFAVGGNPYPATSRRGTRRTSTSGASPSYWASSARSVSRPRRRPTAR
ncbi:hypothetical protein BJF78_29440 [Pseudonocardia sp. CNS-139]|nr:hypothetical protein BJF78_29440 [Pseudonocardia sp. CNS-139]